MANQEMSEEDFLKQHIEQIIKHNNQTHIKQKHIY